MVAEAILATVCRTDLFGAKKTSDTSFKIKISA